MMRRDQVCAATPRLPTAVVFDCDGTIADTEAIADRAWEATLAEYGYTPSRDDFRAVIGHPFPQNWSYFAARAALGDRDVFRARLRARFIDLFDRELAVYPDAVATSRWLLLEASSGGASAARPARQAGLRTD
jgi:beta-phosphoglucomutase-like phosphatase (HAD superfamily)